METFLYVLAKGIQLYALIITYVIFARAMVSRFGDEDGLLYMLLFMATEPVVFPVRVLMEKLNLLQGLPVDFSPAVSIFLLTMITAFMPQF